MLRSLIRIIGFFVLLTLILVGCTDKKEGAIPVHKNDHIVLIGNNLASRMLNFGHFETEMQLRYPDSSLFIRNMADPGNTPGFRPHSSRKEPWAFPGADKFYKNALGNKSGSIGFFPTEDEWLTNLEADVVLAFLDTMNRSKAKQDYRISRTNYMHLLYIPKVKSTIAKRHLNWRWFRQ